LYDSHLFCKKIGALEPHFLRILADAGTFYAKALRTIEDDPEAASLKTDVCFACCA
jgi:hypothetical protein